MKEQHENRRVRMTKQLMKDALLELLEEKKLVNISVTAICKKADVHRSTFYKYYSDPAELFKETEQDFLDRIPTPPRNLDQLNQEQLLMATTAFFDDIKENIKEWRVLFSESAGNSFATKLVEYLVSGYWHVSEKADEMTDRFIRIYIANGTVGMLREWIENDCPFDSRKIAELMYFFSRKVTY